MTLLILVLLLLVGISIKHAMLIVMALWGILIVKVIRIYRTRQVIKDHHDDAYLIRYFIYKPKEKGLLWYICGVNRIYLHHIIRSDYDRALHDHPWSFTSVMLWGSYKEIADSRDVVSLGFDETTHWGWHNLDQDERVFKAPCVLRRPATWRHRLVLDKPAWTLVLTSEKKRSWGFWTTIDKWCPWRNYDYVNLTCAEPEELHEQNA